MRYRPLCLLVLLCTCGLLGAHNPQPGGEWCRPGSVVVDAHVYFTREQIQNYLDCNEPVEACNVPEAPPVAGRGVPPVNECAAVFNPEPSTSCGVFDDDYSLARSLVDTYCARYEQTPIGHHVAAHWGQVVSHVVEPRNHRIFYDEDLHHNFLIGDAVELMCLRCMDPATEPTD